MFLNSKAGNTVAAYNYSNITVMALKCEHVLFRLTMLKRPKISYWGQRTGSTEGDVRLYGGDERNRVLWFSVNILRSWIPYNLSAFSTSELRISGCGKWRCSCSSHHNSEYKKINNKSY